MNKAEPGKPRTYRNNDVLGNTAASQRRKTRQRVVILEELRAVTSHPTAVEIYKLVQRRLPKVSLGTVYRNLDLLARIGLIEKLEPVRRRSPL